MTQRTMTPKEIEAFGKKFETWSNSLSDGERTYLKWLIESPKNLSNDQLDKVSGGAGYAAATFTNAGFTYTNVAQRLDQGFLLKINQIAAW